MTAAELTTWAEGCSSDLRAFCLYIQDYLDRRARSGRHTPTDERYRAFQLLSLDLLAALQELSQHPLLGADTTAKDALRRLIHVEQCTQVKNFADYTQSKLRRAEIMQHWEEIQRDLQPIQQAIGDLPPLPPEDEIRWAQAIMAMRIKESARFLEVDTTGLEETDDLIRVTLVNLYGNVLDDILIKPSCPITSDASHANTLHDADVANAPGLPDVWETRILARLVGHHIIGFHLEWDIKQLEKAARRYHLPMIAIIGSDLQRHCTIYYRMQQYPSLATICERIGHPLPSKSAPNRARGQYQVVLAMAQGITDLRPPTTSTEA